MAEPEASKKAGSSLKGVQQQRTAGKGPGKPVSRTVRGGPVGLLLDARGRPLKLPEAVADRRACLQAWNAAVGVFA
jgi:hypothetical protein